jgi:hypothetical protein
MAKYLECVIFNSLLGDISLSKALGVRYIALHLSSFCLYDDFGDGHSASNGLLSTAMWLAQQRHDWMIISLAMNGNAVVAQSFERAASCS